MGRGAVFDADDDFGGGELSLELDVKHGGPSRPKGGLAPSGPPKPMPGGVVTSAVAHAPPQTAPSFRPMPAAVRSLPVPHVAPVETFEAKVLGNFGDPPTEFWKTPLYAWRVRQRLKELKHELVERGKSTERATQAAEQALVSLGQRARSTAEKNVQYGRTLDGLRLHEQTLRQRDGALMAEMDGHNKKLAMIDSKIADLQQALGVAQNEERRIDDELQMAQATVQRAEAKLKRLDIELRSVLGPNDPRRGAQ
jgi:hypothetical protein